jgi:hypothetical protein
MRENMSTSFFFFELPMNCFSFLVGTCLIFPAADVSAIEPRDIKKFAALYLAFHKLPLFALTVVVLQGQTERRNFAANT